MTKRLLALVLSVLMLAAVFAGCGSTGEPTDGGSTAKKLSIGICQLLEHDALDAATQGFKDAVVAAVGEDGVEFNFQNAQNDIPTCSTIVNQFVTDNVDLIMANATPALAAAQSATGDIPILGTSITEYGVALNIEGFNGTVGGNISGTSDLAPLDEQAALITKWFPEAKTVGLLYCSAEANSQYQVDVVKAELEKAGLTATLYPFSDSNDLSSVCTTASGECDVIYVPTDNTVAANTGIIDNICRPAKVPVVAGEEGICAGCGTVTLSISYYDLGYKTGEMAVEVLVNGADISTMAIEYAEPTPKYNETICKELGLDVEAMAGEGYEAISAE